MDLILLFFFVSQCRGHTKLASVVRLQPHPSAFLLFSGTKRLASLIPLFDTFFLFLFFIYFIFLFYLIYFYYYYFFFQCQGKAKHLAVVSFKAHPSTFISHFQEQNDQQDFFFLSLSCNFNASLLFSFIQCSENIKLTSIVSFEAHPSTFLSLSRTKRLARLIPLSRSSFFFLFRFPVLRKYKSHLCCIIPGTLVNFSFTF